MPEFVRSALQLNIDGASGQPAPGRIADGHQPAPGQLAAHEHGIALEIFTRVITFSSSVNVWHKLLSFVVHADPVIVQLCEGINSV